MCSCYTSQILRTYEESYWPTLAGDNVINETLYSRSAGSSSVTVHSSSLFPSFCRLAAFFIFFSTGELGSLTACASFSSPSSLSSFSLFSSPRPSSTFPCDLVSQKTGWSCDQSSSPVSSGSLSHSSSSGSGTYLWIVRSARMLAG